MAQTPTSNSTLLNNAAKDDAVGLDGDFNFTISDLLGNDPGGAAKVNVDTQFFFGDAAPAIKGTIPTIGEQVQYLSEHGITATLNEAGTSFVSFTIGADADPSFNYFVQIGNKGTWSTAAVDVTAPEPLPPVNHAPVAVDDVNAGLEDTIITGNVAANDSDIDGDPLTYELVGDAPAGLTFNANGTYSLDAGNPAYRDIHLNETADVTFDYTVSDGKGGTDTASATITITGNADLYHGSAESETLIKTATSSSGNGQQAAETFHFDLTPQEGFDFENAAVTVTVQGDMDGKNENATVLEVSGADFVNPDGGDVFKFSGTVNNADDKTVNDGFSHDNFTVMLDNELPMLSDALDDGHIDFDVALSGDVGNGTTIHVDMTYDYWM